MNLWFRERNGTTIIASKEDIAEAFKVWDAISESQEFNLPPYVYRLYKDIIIPASARKNEETVESGITEPVGLTRRDITQAHLDIYGRVLADWSLRQQIIPMLENAGLITQEQDANDKRKMLIYPTAPLTILPSQNNSESDGGVESVLDLF